MAITNPADISRAALEAWLGRFTDSVKGFNAQYAQTRAITKYSQLPAWTVDYNYTVPPLSTNLIVGKYDINYLIANSIVCLPAIQVYTDTLLGRAPGQYGTEKNRLFGGVCTLTIDVHLSWPGPPAIAVNLLLDPELLLSSVEVTLFACFNTPYAASNTYQTTWPSGINYVKYSLSRVQTSNIVTGGLGVMQLARYRCAFDIQV